MRGDVTAPGTPSRFIDKVRAKEVDLLISLFTSVVMAGAAQAMMTLGGAVLLGVGVFAAIGGLLFITGSTIVVRVAAAVCLLLAGALYVRDRSTDADGSQAGATTTTPTPAPGTTTIAPPTSVPPTVPEQPGSTTSSGAPTTAPDTAATTGSRVTRPPGTPPPTIATTLPPTIATTLPPGTTAPPPVTTPPTAVVTVATTPAPVEAAPLTCAIMINTLPLPTSGCDGRVTITAFGDPLNKPSAWSLTSATVELNRDGIPAFVGPDTTEACYWTNDDVRAKTAAHGDGIYWMADAAHRLLIERAPSGTVITLYADCIDGLVVADTSSGWTVRVA